MRSSFRWTASASRRAARWTASRCGGRARRRSKTCSIDRATRRPEMTNQLDEIEAIKQLKYRYFRLVDTANWADLAQCFVESATVCYVGGTYRVERSGRAAILEYLASAIHAQCISVHQGGHPEIRLTSPSTATGTWYHNDWFLVRPPRCFGQRASPQPRFSTST